MNTTSPQKVAFWKGNGTPYFREIQVGEISSFGQIYSIYAPLEDGIFTVPTF